VLLADAQVYSEHAGKSSQTTVNSVMVRHMPLTAMLLQKLTPSRNDGASISSTRPVKRHCIVALMQRGDLVMRLKYS
jgi:hypothetical protein